VETLVKANQAPKTLRKFSRHMSDTTFSYQHTKAGTLRIFWQGRCIMTLGGDKAADLVEALADASDDEVQYLLQRVTGNFKRGNERQRKR
jgi:hypothetical protein